MKKQGYPSLSFHDVNKHFAHNKTSTPLYARLGGSIELSVFTIFIPPINEFKKVHLSQEKLICPRYEAAET